MLHNAAAERLALAESLTLRRIDGTVVASVERPCVGALARAAYGIGCRTVYIIPRTRETWDTAPSEEGMAVFPSGAAGAAPTCWTVGLPGVRSDPVVVMDIMHDQRWPMLWPLGGEQLLRAALYVAHVAGVLPRYSPGYLARELMDSRVSEALWLRPLTVDLPPLVARDLAWVRPLPAGTQAAYLAVAADQDLGVGDPVELPASSPAGTLDVPSGYCFFDIVADSDGSRWDGVQLPSPFGERPAGRARRATAQGWYAAPHVGAALRCGWQVDIRRGLYWPERHRIFRHWAGRLWAAREELTDRDHYPDRAAATAAIAIIKATYTQGIGLLNREPQDPEVDDGTSTNFLAHQARRRFYRPDWRAWIMAECYRRRLSAIERFCAAGSAPVAARTDMLVIAQGDLHLWEDGGVLTRPDGLGGYRHEWALGEPEALERVRTVAAQPRPTVSAFLAACRTERR
jgi:hypothetical protein